MVFAKHLQLALVGTSLLFSSLTGQAAAAASFPGCVDNCISSSGCSTSDEKCMCKEARSVLLDSVVSCMFFNCKTELRDIDDTFFDIIEDICEDVRRIPSQKLADAEEKASSWISKLPAVTQPAPKPTKTPEPVVTTEESAPATTEEPSPENSSPAQDVTESSPADTVASPTEVTTPPPASQTTAGSSNSDATNANSNSDSEDDSGSSHGNTDPFGSVGGSAGYRTQASLSLVGLGLFMLAL